MDALLAQKTVHDLIGIRTLSVSDDEAVAELTITEDHVNMYGAAHGGIMALLADSTFAYACNSGEFVTVASSVQKEFLAPAYPGDVLTSVCTHTAGEGRGRVYDMVVTNQEGVVVATGRGRSAATRRKISEHFGLDTES